LTYDDKILYILIILQLRSNVHDSEYEI